MGTESITVNLFILGLSLCDLFRTPGAWASIEKEYSADEQRCPYPRQFCNDKFYLSVEEHVKTQQENCGRSNFLRIDFYMVLMTKKKCFFKIFHKYCLISL